MRRPLFLRLKKGNSERIMADFLSLRIDNNKLTEKCKFPLAILAGSVIMLSMREKCFFSQVKVKFFTNYNEQ